MQYSQPFSMTLASLWNWYWDKIDDVDDNASGFKSIKCKSKIVGKIPELQPWPEPPPLPPSYPH